MALALVLRKTNFFPYRTCEEPGMFTLFPGSLSPPFCTGPNIYRESITLLDSFVYHEATDRYYLIILTAQREWPSWNYVRCKIHPETGIIEEKKYLGSDNAVQRAWTSTMWNGGLNKTFAFYELYPYSIVEVDPLAGLPSAAQVANPVVTSLQIPMLSASTYVNLVSPERKKLISASGTEGLVVYDYSTYPAAGVKLSAHPFHELFCWSGGYEDDQRAWFLYSGTISGAANNVNQSLLKYNFEHNEIELLTELQVATQPDRLAQICFDSKRKKLAAVRIKADSASGGPNNTFEIYAPRPAMTRITVPVNITRLAPGVRTQFRAHLLGAKGEGGASRVLELDNVSTLGLLPRKQVYTQESGAVQFDYQSSTDIMTDTVTAEFDETKVIL